MRNNLLIYIIIMVCSGLYGLQAQTLQGSVRNEEKELLAGALLNWKGRLNTVETDAQGRFSIERITGTDTLVISYVGYEPYHLRVAPGLTTIDIVVNSVKSLGTVEVKDRKKDSYVSTISTLNVEHLAGNEFKKAACCSLAESFETSGSADVMFSDALSGSKEIQMLGLRGLYTQLLLENRPTLNGLATPFAMDFVPGTWLESIQISKGASSVQNGPYSISGMINSELRKPFNQPPLLLNLYGATTGRFESNLNLNKQFGEHWSAGAYLHYSTLKNQIDRDGDGFLDTPLKDQYNGMFRLFYRSEGWIVQLNYQGLKDQHRGGQILPKDAVVSTYYTTNRDFIKHETWGKAGYTGFSKPNTSVGLIASYTVNDVNARYGTNAHIGNQNSVYLNLVHTSYLFEEKHKYTVGASYSGDTYKEQYADVNLDRTDKMPGIYAEYNYCMDDAEKIGFWDKAGITLGMRADHHNRFGWIYTPRMNGKYSFSDNAIFRFNAGLGYRYPNPVSDNIGQLISSRKVLFTTNVDMEKAWNYGLNFSYNYKLFNRPASVIADLYRTDFVNQLVMDMDQDARYIYFYNLQGQSWSNSAQLTVQSEVLPHFSVKLVYKYNDVQTTYNGELLRRPMTPAHRGLVVLDYQTPNKKWMFNAGMPITGSQRMPHVHGVDPALLANHPATTPAYVTINTQVTYFLKQLEIYAGIENLTNYVQKYPIIGYQNPFGSYFDATQVYAPTLGIRGYVGIRLTLFNSVKEEDTHK